jgi:DNA invertase Pin-like site-specific DNA recombinase
MARRTKASEPVSVTEAIAYLRVSTAGQAASGLGLDAQRTRVEAYCTAKGWTLVETYIDAGVSAKTLDRLELQKAIAALRPGRVLVALKLDRLTRTARDLDDLTDRVLAAGGEWATVEENFDTSTATGRAMVRLVAVLAQMERELIGERTRVALQAKRTRGERLGTTPLGYRTEETATGRRVVMDPHEQETVRMARELFNAGRSYRAIAAELTAAGRTTKRGGRWHAETVACLIRTRYLEEIAA